MRPTPILAAFLLAFILVPGVGSASQDAVRVLRIGAVSGDALGAGEATALRGLISSYVIERGGFRVIDAEGRPLSLEEPQPADGRDPREASLPLAADYVLKADASRIGGRITLSLEVAKTATGEKKSVAEAFTDLNDLILSSRRLTAALLDKAFGAQGGTSASPSGQRAGASALGTDPSPKLAAIAGTWDGDKGIDSVSLRPDGRGFALLDSGARMLLKAAISGSFVIVAQDQPNSPDFYRPDLDPKSARIVSSAARPWKWVFSLSADGSTLTGYKESVFVKVDEKGAVSVDNDYSRDALWTRRSR
jgi:hypothetical protein